MEKKKTAVPKAKPTVERIDIHEVYRRTMERYPITMAKLAE